MRARKRRREEARQANAMTLEKTAPVNRGISKPLLVGICVALALGVLLVYAQTFKFGFVAYDDDQYVYENPMVKAGLSLAGIGWAMTTFFYANWHPLTWISYMLDAQLFGLNAGGFHAVNVILHLGATVLLFLALARMTKQPLRCALVAGISALHPLHAESVAWISERKDVLSTFLEMVALLLYVRYTESRTVVRYVALAAVFALGLMAKPMLVTFPFILLLLDFWPLGRLEWPPRWAQSRTLVIEKIPLVVLSAIAGGLTFAAQRNYGAVAGLEHLPLSGRLANAAISYVAYIWQAIWPANLGVLYPVTTAPVGAALLAAAVLVAVTVAAVRSARSRPYLLMGWLWYVGMLVPVIGLVQVGAQSRADRYTYVPLVGLSIAVIWAIGDWVQKRPYLRSSVVPVCGVVLLALLVSGYRQVGYWQSSRTLFEHTIAVTGPNRIMQNNLGVALAGEGDYKGAMEQYREALAIDPDYAEAHTNLGHELLRAQQFGKAEEQLREALRLKPDSPDANADFALILAARGEYAEAAQHLTESLRVAPGSAINESNLCYVLLESGRADQALTHCEEAVRLQPNLADAHFNLGNVLAAQGRKADARAEFTRATDINPGHAGARQALQQMDGK